MAKKKDPPAEKARPAISAGKLKSLMVSARSARKDMNEIAGTLGSEIKTAVDNNYLNRKVFRTIVMLDRMEPEKLREFLEDFEFYLDVSGLQKRADSAPAMNFGPGAGEEEDDEGGEETKPAGGKTNVSAFPKPTTVAAE